MYTKENLDNYKKLNAELCIAQEAFTKRACEVFHRIFTEYLSKYEIDAFIPKEFSVVTLEEFDELPPDSVLTNEEPPLLLLTK